MAAKQKKRNYPRLILQLGILALLLYMLFRNWFDKSYAADYEAYCPFGGMQAFGSYLKNGSLACSMTTTQIALGLVLLAAVVIFGKLFCAYVCPIGTVTEWLGKWGRKFKIQITLSGWADRILRLLKYALLFITLYFTLTSSELFCRTFDPFYASFTGFGHDVNLWYAITALIITIGGSIFIRQFWCKYFCPLGAITNLGVYALPVSALILLWSLLTFVFGLPISWIWLLAAICIMGFLLEATTLRFLIFPGLKITRNAEICTSCRICDKQCPMGLDVSKPAAVVHIDCHLCTDCIAKCPEKGALSINKRKWQYLPAIVTVVLAAGAILYSMKYELPTISEKWGTNLQVQNADQVEIEGLKSIKCFGSSRAFANQMKEVEGVIGVETFVKHHRVRVYFDPSITSKEKIKEAVFSPFKEFFSLPSGALVSELEIGIDRCFDPNDQWLLVEQLRQQKGVLAVETHFGEPVRAKIYFDESQTNPLEIKRAILKTSVTITEGGNIYVEKTDFKLNEKGQTLKTIATSEFQKRFFEEKDITFNDFEKYKSSELLVFSIPFADALKPEMQEWIPYLISHCSNNDFIVRFKTIFSEKDPLLELTYVQGKTSESEILKLIKEPDLLVHYETRPDKKVGNPFTFK